MRSLAEHRKLSIRTRFYVVAAKVPDVDRRKMFYSCEHCSPRLVSISVVPDIDSPHETDTMWVMQYGQFLDHDLTSTPVFRMSMFYNS